MLAASVCPRNVLGKAAPKNDRPKAPVPKPPCGKCPKRGVGYSLGGGLGPTSSAGLGMARDYDSGLRVPAGCPRHSRAQKRTPEGPRPTTPHAENTQNEGWAIALVGGWGQLCPLDSEWAEILRAASVCPRDVLGKAAPKNERPKAPVPQPPSGKCPKRGVGYSLGGGLGPTSSAGLGMGRDFASGLRVPTGCPGRSREQKRPPECPRPTTPQRKMPETRGGL